MKRLALVSALLLLGSGCGPKLITVQAGLNASRASLEEAVALGALECSPVALATAETSLRFTELEVEQGDLRRAEEHLTELEGALMTALAETRACTQVSDQPPATTGELTPEYLATADDTDGDLIVDDLDACPQEPEDRDGWEDDDGCPEDDNDGDGVLDLVDRCRDDAEDIDGHRDEDGCPDPDNDGDGIFDREDDCPDEPETVNQVDDEDGCPDSAYEFIAVADDQVIFDPPIEFIEDATDLPEGFDAALAELVDLLQRTPTMVVRIEGHTDNRGDVTEKLSISEARAGSVVAWLIANGAPAERVSLQGYGGTQPTTTNRTSSGRARNNRVAVTIVRR